MCKKIEDRWSMLCIAGSSPRRRAGERPSSPKNIKPCNSRQRHRIQTERQVRTHVRTKRNYASIYDEDCTTKVVCWQFAHCSSSHEVCVLLVIEQWALTPESQRSCIR